MKLYLSLRQELKSQNVGRRQRAELVALAEDLSSLSKLRPSRASKAAIFESITGKPFGWRVQYSYLAKPAMLGILAFLLASPLLPLESPDNNSLSGVRHSIEHAANPTTAATVRPSIEPQIVAPAVSQPARSNAVAPATTPPEPRFGDFRQPDRRDFGDGRWSGDRSGSSDWRDSHSGRR